MKNEGNALRYVPEEMRSDELCFEAIKNNGHTLYNVPDDKKSVELCVEALKHDIPSPKYDIFIIEYVPENLREECINLVQKRTGQPYPEWQHFS